MVAKSFQAMKIMTEPFQKNGKFYVKVLNEKTGTIRKVRFYSENEYFRMYPEERKNAATITVENNHNSIKHVLGFDNGFITIFKGNQMQYLEWFKNSIARYHRAWGWYVVSTDELPQDIPDEITPIRLNWDAISNEDGTLKTENAIISIIDNLIYDDSPSEFVGSNGDRLEIEVTITNAIQLDGNFGKSTMHIMEDQNKNVYVWITASKSWTPGTIKKIRGTVKDHKIYKKVKQTILKNCREVN